MKQEMFDFLMGTLVVKQQQLICELIVNLKTDIPAEIMQGLDKDIAEVNVLFETITSVRKIKTQPEYPLAN